MIESTAVIHPTAIIEGSVRIGARVHVGPYCHLEGNVEIGEGTVLKSHVVVTGNTRIGSDNIIYPFATIGEDNQDLKYKGEPTLVEIGDRNKIRESVTVHRGTVQGGGITKIGNDNLLMVNAHVAHDCVIADHCILANNATLAGHVTLDEYVVLGGMSAVLQFCSIGAHVMVGGCSGIAQDVPPYVKAQGNHASPKGLNIVGLERRGFSDAAIRAIREAYKELYRSGKTLEEAKVSIAEIAAVNPEVQPFYEFLSRPLRGLIR